MIPDAQIQEIQKYLERAQQPLFFFDEDTDGLVSYLLLKRTYNKGHGIGLKTAPDIESVYLQKIEEYHPDLVVLLDKPYLSQETLDQMHVPIVWIDHHQPLERIGKHIHYYNPLLHEPKDNRPTSYWAYHVVGKPLWLAMIGIVSDWYIPEFIDEFPYQQLLNGKRTPPELLFDSPFGILVCIFEFLQKGPREDVKKSIQYLEEIESPEELLQQTTARGRFLFERFQKINKEYQLLLAKGLAESPDPDLYVFTYPDTKNSFTSRLSNELFVKIPSTVIIVGRVKGDDIRLSLRSSKTDVLPILQRALRELHGFGGGHPRACGATFKLSDFDRLVAIFREELALQK